MDIDMDMDMDSKADSGPSVLGLLFSASGLLALVGVWIGYRLSVALYNISPWHPLSGFPGPKLAAASYFYEAYYDWFLTGRYGHEIRRMHERYGEWTRTAIPLCKR